MIEMVFLEEAPTAGKEHAAKDGTTIGREGCDIVLEDVEVSRRHAALREVDGSLAVEDLDSTNGTFVNDQRVSGTMQLQDGDQLRIGSTVWRIQAPSAPTKFASVQAPPGATRAAPVPPAPQTTKAAPAEPAPPAPQTTKAAPAEPAPAEPAPQRTVAEPAQPVAAAAAPAPSRGQSRGDVPAPDFAPSAIRKVLPDPALQQAPPFAAASRRKQRGSAARRLEATLYSYAVVLATAGGVIYYFAQR